MDDNTQETLITIALLIAAVALIATGHGYWIFWLGIAFWILAT